MVDDEEECDRPEDVLGKELEPVDLPQFLSSCLFPHSWAFFFNWGLNIAGDGLGEGRWLSECWGKCSELLLGNSLCLA